jgi:hypothetical protein
MLDVIWAYAIGCIGIWALQIIGLSAFSLIDSNGNRASVSLVVEILFCKIGIFVGKRDEVYVINKVAALEVYI